MKMNKRFWLSVFFLFLFCLNILSYVSFFIPVNAQRNGILTDDAYVYDSSPDSTGGGNYAYWGNNTSLGVCRTLLQFDLSSQVAGTWKLYVYVSAFSGSGVTSYLYSVDDDSWDESSVTWNNQPSHVSLIATASWVASKGWIVFEGQDLVNYVNNQIAGDKIVSFKIVSSDESKSNTYQKIYTQNYHLNYAPYLIKVSDDTTTYYEPVEDAYMVYQHPDYAYGHEGNILDP